MVRQGCVIPWIFNVYTDAAMKEVKMGIRRIGVRFLEEGKEWRLPVLLVLYDELEKDSKIYPCFIFSNKLFLSSYFQFSLLYSLSKDFILNT